MYLSASEVAVSTWGTIASARPLPFNMATQILTLHHSTFARTTATAISTVAPVVSTDVVVQMQEILGETKPYRYDVTRVDDHAVGWHLTSVKLSIWVNSRVEHLVYGCCVSSPPLPTQPNYPLQTIVICLHQEIQRVGCCLFCCNGNVFFLVL